MPGAALELHEREEISRALVEDPQACWAAIARRVHRSRSTSAVAGHWEVDQIIGANNRSSMIWLTERQSRYLIPITMPDGYAADAVFAGLVEGRDAIPAHLRRSLTFDCGAEWANWRRLADHYDLQVWFCDPHSPRQRGQIENLNRQIRWWFPRGTDLRLVTVAQAEHAAHIINHQRRRSLNHQSPAELYAALTVH